MKTRSEPVPVLLTKHDAMTFAAEQMRRMAHDFSLAALMSDIVERAPTPHSDEIRKSLDDLGELIPEPAMQAAACNAAARAIQDIVTAERLAAARAEAKREAN